MSKKGDSFYNTSAESFFVTLKLELAYHVFFAKLRSSIFIDF